MSYPNVFHISKHMTFNQENADIMEKNVMYPKYEDKR